MRLGIQCDGLSRRRFQFAAFGVRPVSWLVASHQSAVTCRRSLNLVAIALSLLAYSLATSSTLHAQSDVDKPTDDAEFFEKRIRPALEKHCLACHSNTTEINGGLLLDSKPGWERGGDTGKAIASGRPDESLLVRAIRYDDPHLQMPPDGPMPKRVVEDFQQWIRNGAFDPRLESPPPTASQGLSLERAQEHWCYRPLQQATIPDGDGATTIDRFLNAKLASQSLLPNEQASKAVLLRRLALDLHGLPPTQDQLARFMADSSDDAYERLVDELLSSPHYGERMARHWLDVVRFGESLTLRGFVMGNAWRYRDYCIRVFNDDVPWNQAMREQVAGDLLAADSLDHQREQFVATTFWLMGNSNLEEQDKQQLEMDIIDEQLDTFGKAFLGQTLGCARCHDHKFDPIPTHDYYALAGILKSSQVVKHSNVSTWIERPLPMHQAEQQKYDAMEKEAAEAKSNIDKLRKQLAKLNNRTEPSIKASELPGIVIDDEHAKKIGGWEPSQSSKVFVGSGYLHDKNERQGAKTVSFEPASLPPGTYEVRVSYTEGPNRATNATITVYSADGDSPHRIDQRVMPPIDGLWLSLGKYRFEKDGQAYVTISNEEADGHVIADAVQFLREDALLNTTPRSTSIAEVDANDAERRQLSDQIKQLEKRQKQVDEYLTAQPKAMALLPVEAAGDLPIHIRGDVHNLGKIVPRGAPRFVSITANVITTDGTYDRRDLRHPA